MQETLAIELSCVHFPETILGEEIYNTVLFQQLCRLQELYFNGFTSCMIDSVRPLNKLI